MKGKFVGGETEAERSEKLRVEGDDADEEEIKRMQEKVKATGLLEQRLAAQRRKSRLSQLTRDPTPILEQSNESESKHNLTNETNDPNVSLRYN